MEFDQILPYYTYALNWLQHHFLIYPRLIQFGIIILSFLIAWIGFYYYSKITKRLPHKEKSHFTLRPSFFIPGVASVFLWFADAARIEMDLHTHVVTTVASLSTAWVVVILVGRLIKEPLVRLISEVFVYTVLALTILRLFDNAKRFLQSIVFKTGETSFNLLDIIEASIVITFFVWISLFISHLANRKIEHDRYLSKTTKSALEQLIKMALLALSVILALKLVGIDLTIIAFFAAAFGLGLGAGLKKLFSNMVSGFIVMYDKSVQPGDYIEVNGFHGVVEEINSRQTTLISTTNKRVFIPNEHLHNMTVANFSKVIKGIPITLQFSIKTDDDFMLNYESNVRYINEEAMKVIKEVAGIQDKPAADCELVHIQDTSLTFEISAYIDSIARGQATTKSEINNALIKRLQSMHQSRIERDPTRGALRSAQRYVELFEKQKVAK